MMKADNDIEVHERKKWSILPLSKQQQQQQQQQRQIHYFLYYHIAVLFALIQCYLHNALIGSFCSSRDQFDFHRQFRN